MRSLREDEVAPLTKLDLIGPKESCRIFFYLCLSLVIGLFLIHVPNATLNLNSKKNFLQIGNDHVSVKGQFTKLDSFNSFLILYFDIDFFTSKEIQERKEKLKHKKTLQFPIQNYINQTNSSKIILLDDSSPRMKCIIRTINSDLNIKKTIKIDKLISFEDYQKKNKRKISFPIYHTKNIDFSRLAFSGDLFTSDYNVKSISFKAICLSQITSFSTWIFLTATSLAVSIFFYFNLGNYMKPSRLDHWATLFLGLLLTLIDGPWMILRNYSSSSFSTIFEILPQIYHSSFMVFAAIFFSVRVPDGHKNIFLSSWIMRISNFILYFILNILEYICTDGMPLSTLSSFIYQSKLLFYILLIGSVYHIAMLYMLVTSAKSLKIMSSTTLLICTITFTILEFIQFFNWILKFLPFISFGFNTVCDMYYIYAANAFTVFLMYMNLPVSSMMELDSSVSVILDEKIEQQLECLNF